MTPIWILLMLLALALLLVGVVSVVVLVRLGVIAHYAVKKEAPEQGEYGLDQSREVDKRAF